MVKELGNLLKMVDSKWMGTVFQPSALCYEQEETCATY